MTGARRRASGVRPRRASARLLVLAVGLGGCGVFAVDDSPSVPDRPTWASPVKQIMDNHCNRCHGAKPDRGAPGNFRLDVYANQGRVAGAAAEADSSVESVNRGRMPPGAPLGPNDTAILQRWLDQAPSGGFPAEE